MVNALLFVTASHRVWNLEDRYPRRIAEKFPAVRVVAARTKEEAAGHLPEAEVLYAWSLPERLLPIASRLRWWHIPSAGVDGMLYPALVESRIRVTCSRGISSPALADHAFGLILAFSRGIGAAIRDPGPDAWPRERFMTGDPMPVELDGRVLGILGYGSIGEELARRGRAFGMRIHALKRNRVREEALVDRMFGPVEMSGFLGSVDFLVLTLPLTSATAGLLDDDAFARMKPGAFLVNIARGGLVREEALIRALESGRLAGAGLDVFAEEPLRESSPLRGHPRVFRTPHIGGLHPHYLDRATALFIVNLGRYLAGEPLLHEVDKREGY